MSRVGLLGLGAKRLKTADDEDLLLVGAFALVAASHEVLQELLLLICFIYLFKSLDALPLLLLGQLSLKALLGLGILVAVIESTERVERGLGEAFLKGLRASFVRFWPFDVVLDAVILLREKLIFLIDVRKLA